MVTMVSMKKTQAIKLLGGTPKIAAQAMGYVSAHAIYMWPINLPQATADRVRGVVARTDAKPAANKSKSIQAVSHD